MSPPVPPPPPIPGPPPALPGPPGPIQVTFPGNSHLTVDLLGQVSVWTWLAPVLAFIGVLILFSASMITLWRSNKAANTRSEADRAETRDRDFRLWQRDNMLRVSSEIVESAIDAENEYTKIAHHSDPLANDAFEKIDTLDRKIAANTSSLRIAGAQDAAQQSVALRKALTSRDLVRTVSEFNVMYRSQRDAIGSAGGATDSDEFQRRIAMLRVPEKPSSMSSGR